MGVVVHQLEIFLSSTRPYPILLISGDNEDGNEMTVPGVLDGNDVT